MEQDKMISKPETLKDTVQVVVESGASRVGSIAMIVTGAVRDIAREVGGFATDVFEMLEASRRARADRAAGAPDKAE
jgi:hypothetical protein